MMMYRKLVLLASLIASANIGAQPARGGQRQGGAGAQRGMQGAGAQRGMMERRLQSQIDSVVRRELALTDDQFGKLREVATKIEQERQQLRSEDSRTRLDMRRELAATPVNEDKVAELLDKLPGMERRRVDLLEREQRELSKFLTPSQRARYFALQDLLRRNMQETMRKRLGMEGPGEGPPPPRRDGRRTPPPR